MVRLTLVLIFSTFILFPCSVQSQEPATENPATENAAKAAKPITNQVYVKLIMPIDSADADDVQDDKVPGKDRPVVEAWIAEDLKKNGQDKFTAVTGWKTLDPSFLESTEVWEVTKLGGVQYCCVDADIPERTEGQIKINIDGWSPGGARVAITMKDEPGSRMVAAVEDLKSEEGMPYVAVFIGLPSEFVAPAAGEK